MKQLLIFTLLICAFGNVQAKGKAKVTSDVLIENVTHVAFAPPAYRGTFRLQLLSDGIVQKIDNKNKVTLYAKLENDAVEKIRSTIDAIESDELTKPTTPPCMDAPTRNLLVYNSKGENLKIWMNSGCRQFTPVDSAAMGLVEFFQDLEGVLISIDNF